MSETSSEHYSYVEQDRNSAIHGDELPTYDDLAAQNGPNSRFGRWRGWIEKRAAERYFDISPEERRRRRERGWGNDEAYAESGRDSPSIPVIVKEPPTPMASLHIQTNNLSDLHISNTPEPSPPLPPLPAVSLKLHPTHVRMHQFGSRFLPHTTSPIRCLLPLLGDRLLLIGHDEGLSVLDMYPREWYASAPGISVKGPEEAQARAIWTGEGVYQMSILEAELGIQGTPQGVVLALVGPEADSTSSKESEAPHLLRMYNLASLTSLAKWAISQKGARPLDLRRPSNWHAQQSPPKKHRAQNSIARGLKNLIDSPSHSSHASDPHPSSYQALLSPSPSVNDGTSCTQPNRSASPHRRQHSDESGWDVVDELPLRWATDFVPLAAPGSRLSSSSVLSYTLWGNDDRARARGGRLLAVATKSNILLYETPRGERAFRFLKEFYTPLVPRSMTFFQQTVSDHVRTPSESSSRHSHKHSDSTGTVREIHRTVHASAVTIDYGTQLSLFVTFDKKAGWIRLADSAVGEIELYDDNQHSHLREASGPSSASHRRSRASLDSSAHLGKWIPPGHCELPLSTDYVTGAPEQTMKAILLTRGKRTHILPSPLPTNYASFPPLRVVTWKNTPAQVVSRVYDGSPPDMDGYSTPAYLQLIALGELGIEIQEISLSFLKNKGKGKARADDILYVEEDTGGDAGFLCIGGHWDRQQSAVYSNLNRSFSTLSESSTSSSIETQVLAAQLEREQGVYCWCRKGLEDWRVFWLGGSLTADYEEEEQ